MASAAISVVMIVLLGLPLAFSLTRRVLFSLVLAPLVTALTATAAVILMLAAGGRLLYWFVPLVLAQYALVPKLLVRRREPLPSTTSSDIAWLTGPLLLPFLEIKTPPTGWDAHSIWWMHAGYFTQGATFARSVMSNSFLAFTHADYPPLASAPVSVVWSLLDGYPFRAAQAVSSLLTLSSIALLAYAVRAVTSRARPAVSRAAGIGVGFAAWYSASWGVASGMCDAMWAAACVAAALLLLIGRDWPDRPLLPVMLLTMAALTKNEGTIMVGIVAVTVTVKYRGALARIWPVWISVAAGLLWMALARVIGAVSDVTDAPRLRELLAGDPEIRARLAPTVHSLWELNGQIVSLAAATAVVGALLLRHRRRALGFGSDLWLWFPGLAYGCVLVMTYLVTTKDIAWYLATSADRVSGPVILLATASAACWGTIAVTTEHPSMDTRGSFHPEHPALASK